MFKITRKATQTRQIAWLLPCQTVIRFQTALNKYPVLEEVEPLKIMVYIDFCTVGRCTIFPRTWTQDSTAGVGS